VKHWVLVDDSGTHGAATFSLIAGYTARPKIWEKIEARWRAVLARPEYKVDVFHANVFFNRKKIKNKKKNPYLGWSDKKANDFLGHLLKIIDEQRKFTRIVAGIRVSDFAQYSYSEQCCLTGHVATPSIRKSRDPAPFHLVFRLLLHLAGQTSTSDTKLHFIVADQEEYRQRALDGWALMKALGTGGYEHRLQYIGFAEPICRPGLQVADLLSWQLHNAWTRHDSGLGLSRQNRSALNILNKRLGPTVQFTRDDMEAWINQCVTPEDREFLRSLTREHYDKEIDRVWQRQLARLRKTGSLT
jgi:hypothetical protein